MAKRKAREEIDFEEEALLAPLDIYNLGSSDDPCFGKLWDLTNQVCSSCGDIEICGIVFSQKAHIIHQEKELEKPYKDLEQHPTKPFSKMVKADILKLKTRGYSKTKIAIKLAKKYNKSKAEIKNYI